MATCASFVANVTTGRLVSWEGRDRLAEEASRTQQEAREWDPNQFLSARHCATLSTLTDMTLCFAGSYNKTGSQ